MNYLGLSQLSRIIMSGIVGKCLTYFALLFVSNVLFGQDTNLPGFYILDTLKLENAVSVYFTSKKHQGIPIIVNRSQLEKLDIKRYKDAQKFMQTNGYLGIDMWRFIFYLEKEIYDNFNAKDSLQMQLLHDDLSEYVYRNSRFEPYKSKEIKYRKIRKNIELADIPSKHFLFILVNSSKLREWTMGRTDFNEIDNLYIPALIMLPWIEMEEE